MSIRALSLYRPAWEQSGNRVAGPDEDVLTLAVAAARPLTESRSVERVVVVTATPDVVVGFGTGVVARALDLPDDATVELRVGGGPALLDAVLSAGAGTLVVGVDLAEGAAAAGAVRVGDGRGAELHPAGRVNGSLPMRVRTVDSARTAVYGDGRVERELATRPVVERLRAQGAPLLVGVSPSEARRWKAHPAAPPTQGPAGVVFAMAEAVSGPGPEVRIVALDAGSGVAADLLPGPVDVLRDERPALPAGERPVVGEDVEIPFSMPAYARAFEAKVGLVAARCSCGEMSYPPRQVCLNCGTEDDTRPVSLRRTGEVYTCVKVHVPIPGVAGPYGLAIVALDESPVRVLAPIADVGRREAGIGERGSLILRRLAVREGVPDYGYAFRCEPGAVDEGVSA
ncbi:Zn-ribbon domain-containing OB-fold protein [Pseudonocardia sp. CA-107938]|uniref:Zn-ribbon domain-containing OB-fold protein n=1 Tax=Pseudonocardia sp. CA-107938 TaxID=3240021 RepID=UPI003D934769